MNESEVWTFGPARDGESVYADGTRIPNRSWRVCLNGVPVAEIDTHMHKRRGRDGRTDVSFGFTAVSYGPPQKGN